MDGPAPQSGDRGEVPHRCDARRVGYRDDQVDQGGSKAGSIRGRPMPSFREGMPVLYAGQSVTQPGKYAEFSGSTAAPGAGVPTVQVSHDGRRGRPTAGAHHDPGGRRFAALREVLRELWTQAPRSVPVDGVPHPVEVVQIVATDLFRESTHPFVDGGRRVDGNAAAAVRLDPVPLGRRGPLRDDGRVRQAEEPGEVGLRDGHVAARRLEERSVLLDVARTQCVEKQVARRPVLEASGGAARLVLEVQGRARRPGEREGQERRRRFGGTVVEPACGSPGVPRQ